MSINSKKLVSAALTATTLLWMVGATALLPVANAQSTSIAAEIAALQSQIAQLTAQLNAGGTTTTTTTYDFTSDLTVGSTGAQVSSLQQLLISKGYLTAVSAPTGYFGALTQAALAKFQAANGISPAAGYFGPITRAFVNAMSTTTTTTGTGTGTGTGTTTTAPATGLSVSLASDNPVAGSLITSSASCTGSSGAARVPVLAFDLTASNSGAVTVTAINFHKTGVLADSSVAGAYLIQNGQVVAQYNSVSNGVISFSGIDLSIPAGQTEEYQLAIDVASGLSAGNTTGFSLNAASDITAWDSNNNAITPSGSLPLTGNTFTVTSVSNPCLASLTITTSSIGTSVTAGTQGNIVGGWTFQVNNNPLWLKSIAIHIIGSVTASSLENVKLLINGAQVGATLSAVGSNNVAYFNLTASPAELNTGSNNVQLESDITGSPSYTFQAEILNGYDILAVDSQYNVPVSVAITSGVDAVVQIQKGQTTTSQDASTPTGNIAKGVSQVTLAKFDVYAAGEPTKVKFLGFDLTFTGVNTASDTSINQMVQNVSLTDDAGEQIGSTINQPPSGLACDDVLNPAPSGYTTTEAGQSTITTSAVTYVDCFGSSGSPINYVIPANTTRVLSLKADIESTANFSTVTANLVPETNNLQGQISSQLNSSSGANGSALSLSNSSLTATQNSAFGTQTISKGSTDQQIGSYNLTASSAEGVNVSTLSVLANYAYLQNLKVFVNGVQFGNTQPTVSQGTTYTFSGTPFNVPEGTTVAVNVFADINSSATGASSGGATSLTGLSGSGQVSNSSISLGVPSIAGQNITVAGGSSVSVTANTGSNPTTGPVAMGTTGNTLAAYNFQETANIENVKVTDLYVSDVLSTSTAYATSGALTAILPSFSGLTLWNGGTQLGNQANYIGTTTVGGTPAFLYHFSFGNSTPFVIPRNSTLPVTLKGNVNAYTAGNVSDDSVHTFEVVTSTAPYNTATSTVVALGQTSNNPTAIVLSGAAGNPQTVLRNSLTFSSAQNGATTNRSKSASDQLATLTFTPNNSGQITLNTLVLTFTGNALASSTGANDAAFASSTYLALGTPGNFTGTTFAPASATCVTSVSCTVQWNFGSSISGYQIQNSPVTFTLVANTSQNVGVAVGQNSVSLFTTLATPSAVLYTDGTDAASTTVSGIGLPASVITPLQISGVQYTQGS
jgi:Putative peptidoglycan binding domain